ncbi:hypothetical protein [Flavobacterium macacae]|uniref:Nuclease n=1 Tax=Flavobacterium macacae TaxID=2488993 RepID=A0A3P3W2R0_9FLAO|nr:hypothetical protein [Flavobacterium macacae]RRJ89250.1 hypothetical protein EG849_13350 [Flavobacterium macacae]
MYKFLLFLLVGFSMNAQSVYKTPSGKKFHKHNCRMVKNVSQKIDETDAYNLGLEPCKICKPSNTNALFSNSKKAKGIASTVQCNGKTKKGNRCKRRTSIANGYCFQHNPI